MRILLINNYAEPGDGAAVMTRAFREELRARGHDARILASNADSVGGSDGPEYSCLGTRRLAQTLLQVANPSAFRALRRALAEFRPDVAHVRTFLWQLSPLILPLLRGTPSLHHILSYKPICPRGTKLLPDGSLCGNSPGAVCYRSRCLTLRSWGPMMVQHRLWRRWRHVFDAIVVPSHAVKRRLQAEGLRVTQVIPDAVPARPVKPPLSGPPVAAFAGRLVREKGVDPLLRAFAAARERTPEARLLIAGDGPERGRLESLAGSLGIASSVQFLGHLPRPEIERLFDKAWLLVVPSLWEEPFGLITAEAAMRGVAVVASEIGGLPEVIEDGKTGILTPPGGVPELARAIGRLLTDRDLAESMGRAGHVLAQSRFDMAGQMRRFLDLYEGLSARGAAAPAHS